MGAGILFFFGLALAGYLLVAPLAAFVFAVRANRRNEDLLLRIHDLELRLAELSRQHGRAELPAAALGARDEVAPAPDPPALAVAVDAGTAETSAAVAGAAATPAGAPTPLADAAATPAGAPTPLAGAAFAFSAAAPPATTDVIAAPPGAAVATQPHPAAAVDAGASAASSTAHQGAAERPSIEERLGLTWLTRAGAATFLLGALFFFKYAADNAWIGPAGRVAIGAATGAALLVAAEVIRRRTQRRFVHALLGLGLAILIASVWASAVLYELVPIAAAFAADTAILLLGAALALRHRGEVILILTLVASFLNPVVLSTGQDRRLLLFSYLLLMTSVVHAVSAKLGFRAVPWLALAGHAALFWGWYDHHFDASASPLGGDPLAAPSTGGPAEAAPGLYFPLAARAVPLAFVALAAAQAILRALWVRAPGGGESAAAAPAPVGSAAADPAPSRGAAPAGDVASAAPASAKAFGAAALVLAHAGAWALLFDAPRALAAAAIALAVASTLGLRALGASGWLIAPMGSAFLTFAASFADAPPPHRPALVAMTAAWALVYIAGWLRGAGRARRLERRTAIECAAGAALFACVAGMLLLGTEAALFALALTLAAGFVAWLAARAELPALLLAAAAASAGALAAAAPGALAAAGAQAAAQVDVLFLGASALVMLVFLGAAGATARRRGEPGAPALSWPDALAASVATLGFVAAALGATPEETPTLRALLTAGAGALDLALGAALLGPGARRGAAGAPADRIALLLGQALALFAAAVAFGLGGATVTVVWGILAAVAAAIAARTAERAWLAVAALLFLAAIVRAFAVDWIETEALVTTWLETRGREGRMAVPVALNARAYALAGVGAALLAAGHTLSRGAAAGAARGRPALRAAARTALGAGYALLIGTLVVEVRSAIAELPAAPPVPLDAAEFAELAAQHEAALAAQRGSLAMATTLVLALAAIALLTAGFAARDAFHRHAGLLLFAVTIAKLLAWDVWHVERIYQIALFTGVGALLVGGGFLYARFGKRLVTLLRTGPGGAAGMFVLLAAATCARPADAQTAAPLPTERHALVRPIDAVDAPGDHHIEVDLDLYRQSRAEELLADVRIAGPDGAEVPYVLREAGAAPASGRIAATMLDPGVDTAGGAHATWALDAPGTRHCRVELSVLGSTFLREARVDTGADMKSLTEVARGAYVYRIPQGAETVEQLSVSYPLSRAALVRIRLLGEGAPARGVAADVRITGGAVSCEPPAAAPGATLPLAIVETQRDPEAKTTVVTLDAGADGVPLQAVQLDVATPEFSRRVEVASTTYRAVWPHVGGGLIYNIRPRGNTGVALALTRIPVSPTRKRFLRLTIHDGDSAPLSITGAHGEVRAREIVFRAGHAGPHRLYVGDPLGERPRYDLADVLDRVERERPPGTAWLGAAQSNPAFGAARVARDLPFTERHRASIGVGLALALLGLSLWAARLLWRGAPPDDAAPPPEGSADKPPPS
ncbi:hypothetical protein SOCE26_031990 [Sorangium cellulosum]|uniref:DUF2339 domain-containing protein n=1 Tax=Sorangium cellulosum TaxID=56 RepID=A0A2L0ER53_SORCE|nr:DUF2339 domain-containing protein [Sorangium cellulosum]AUX41776.1 hypothetical protein SOCE26_031990 [Sorangium cellulosum]